MQSQLTSTPRKKNRRNKTNLRTTIKELGTRTLVALGAVMLVLLVIAILMLARPINNQANTNFGLFPALDKDRSVSALYSRCTGTYEALYDPNQGAIVTYNAINRDSGTLKITPKSGGTPLKFTVYQYDPKDAGITVNSDSGFTSTYLSTHRFSNQNC